MNLLDSSSEGVSLERFEHLLYSRVHEEAGRELHRVLHRLRVGGEFAGNIDSDETRIRLYTRLAAAITAYLADPDLQISQDGLELIAADHSTLSAIFKASAFGNMDHLLPLIGVRDPANPGIMRFESAQHVAKLLLCYSLDSELEIDFQEMFRASPRLALPAFLGMLANNVVISAVAHRRREKLLTLGPLFEQVELTENMLLAIANAYMLSSYAVSEGKHGIKRSFNRMLRRFIEQRVSLPEIPVTRAIKERPTVLVLVEQFASAHAMFRCYGPSLGQLRARFRLVMLGREGSIDEVARELFDEVNLYPPDGVALADVMATVKRVNPDIALYTSVGMAKEMVALSAVRLAPIQAMMLGHPATTQSDAIDYVLVDGLWPGDPGCFSETVIVQRPGSTAFTMYPNATYPEPNIREAPAVLRVAVPASVYKLNAPFLATCQSIARRASRPLEFHFFSSMVGVHWFQAKCEIQRWFPEAVVHPHCNYTDYLRSLGECDLHLSAFPFGGMNSNMDSMRLAIPMVTLRGREMHGQMDAGMMRRVGLPEGLITKDAMDYERAALRVIEDNAERVAVACALANADVGTLFSTIDAEVPADEFLRAVNFIYENHESIQETGHRYWTAQDRESFIATRPS